MACFGQPLLWVLTPLYFGKVDLGEGEVPTFADGEGDDANAVAGYAIGPPVALYEGKTALFKANAFIAVEEYDEIFKSDNLHILVIDEAGTLHNVWDKSALQPFQYNNWIQISSDLSEFEGQVINLMVYFDSYDAIDNSTEGVYLDSIQVIQECDDVPPF